MTPNKVQWRKLVRRALEIPDVIGAHVEAEILADVVYLAIDEPRGNNMEFEEDVGAAVLAEVVSAGVRGDLDWFLMDRPQELTGGPNDALEISESIVVNIRDQDRRMKALPRTAAVSVLNAVRNFVRDHPFDSLD